jgi:hypothetical protein
MPSCYSFLCFSFFVIAVPVLALGCASRRYRVERRQLDCEDANAEAHRALLTRHYQITRFALATPGSAGFIEARRETPNGLRRGRLRIICDHRVLFQPVEGSWFLPDFEFSREVYYALVAMGGRSAPADAGAASGAPPASGSAAIPASQPAGGSQQPAGTAEPRLRVIVRPLDRFEIRKTIGVDLERRGLVVVRVEIANGTARTYELPSGAVVLASEAGNRVPPLGRDSIGRILRESATAVPGPDEAPLPPIDVGATTGALDASALRYGRIGPGDNLSGCLYFPDAAYRGARVQLIDMETGEKEGMIVGF